MCGDCSGLLIACSAAMAGVSGGGKVVARTLSVEGIVHGDALLDYVDGCDIYW